MNTRRIPGGYLPVSWSYLARLDEVPCDVFVPVGSKTTLYATVGANPVSLRAKAQDGVALLVREADQAALRRMLTVSLDRALGDKSITPAARSVEAYEITATIIAGTFRAGDRFDAEEALLVEDTIDLLTKVLSSDDGQLWNMVAAFQRNSAMHHHAINASVYALALAKAAGITDFEQLRDIGRGAILMDLGLTTVPLRVRERNADALDPIEARALRTHPAAGYAIVMRATGEVPSYAHIILEHHERLDGSGYPSRRRAGQISLDSQVVAVADTFDTLVTGTASQPALSPFEALKRMRFEEAGRYNEDLLRAFVSLLGGWDAIRAKPTM